MLELFHFYATCAPSTTIRFSFLFTKQILHESQHQRKCAVSFIAKKQLGMADLSALHFLNQLTLQCFLTNNLRKLHGVKVVVLELFLLKTLSKE